MASATEVGKRLKEAAAADEAKAEAEAAASAPGEAEPPAEPEAVEPEAVEPEQKAKTTAEPSAEQMVKQLDRAITAFHDKLCKIFDVEGLQQSAAPGVVGFLMPGYAEKLPHPDFTRCAVCNGHGNVLTGSLKPPDDERPCPDPRCKGRGYWQKAQAPEPVTQTMVPLPSTPATNGGEWGEAPAWMGDPRLSTPAP